MSDFLYLLIYNKIPDKVAIKTDIVIIADKELKITYHPSSFRRNMRKLANIFKTIRDSFVEVINLLLAQARKATPATGVLSSQDKYVTQMKKELIGSVGTSHEPLLEKYIGRLVILEILKGDKILKFSGVLKDYTANFIEILDVDYQSINDPETRKADLIAPRICSTIRHLGE